MIPSQLRKRLGFSTDNLATSQKNTYPLLVIADHPTKAVIVRRSTGAAIEQVHIDLSVRIVE